jgi:outer membrane receptor protein involved in Fe transport
MTMPSLEASALSAQNALRTVSRSGLIALAVALGAAGGPTTARAQSAPPAPPAEAAPGDPVVELSPFVVSSTSEVGYRATETLSGSRLRTELGNVAASIDVLTEEFLRDVGAISLYDALDFVGNVSTAAGAGGVLPELENAVWFSSPYTSRGFNSSALFADFFSMGKIPLDFYNTGSFTVARGPNSILFGIGSPGGLVNVSRKRPIWGRDLTEIQLRTDSYGSLRGTLDFSKELVRRKLAVRVALLHDDRKEFLEPAEYQRKAAYAAMTYRPFRKTSLTVTAEKGDEFRIFQFATMQYDGVSRWLQAGKPAYTGGPSIVGAANAMDTNFRSGLDREAQIGVLVYGQPGIPVLSWQNMARTERIEINGHPDLTNVRTASFTEHTAIWDFDKVQISGDNRQRQLDWTDITAFLTQEILVPELQLELAFNQVKTDYITVNTNGMLFLQVDANQRLPNGQPNPNFGVPYVESNTTLLPVETNDSKTARATLSYDLDLNDRKIFGFGLGRYTLMGLYEEQDTRSLFAQFRRSFIPTTFPGYPAGPANYNNAANYVRTRTYVNTSLTPAGANVAPYFKTDLTPIDRDGVQDAWYANSGPRDIRDKRASSVVALQGHFWRTKEDYDRVIVTAGLRRDRTSSQGKDYPAVAGVFPGKFWRGNPFEQSFDTLYDGPLNFGTIGAKTESNVPTKTYSAIVKPLKDVSLFYNFSDVAISVSSLFTDIYNRPLGVTTGETEDIGLRVSLLDGRVSASLTRFETVAKDQADVQSIRTTITPVLEDIWSVVDPAGQVFKGFNERYSTLRSDTSEGYEFNLTANVTRGWNTRLAVSSVDTIVTSRLPIVNQYIAEYRPLWEAQRNQPLLPADALAGYATVGNALDRLYSNIADFMALVGSAPQAQRQYKVQLNSTYNFFEGALKGLSLGGGVRWQSKDIIGYAYDIPSLTSPPVVIDSSKPFYGEPLLNVTATVGYTMKVKRAQVRFQLNVNNLFDERGTFARAAIDDLTGNRFETRQQVREPRSFAFTTTVKF